MYTTYSNSHWLFLEPFTYLARKSNGVVIYNTQTNYLLEYKDDLDSYMGEIIDALLRDESNTCVEIDFSRVSPQFFSFIDKLRNKHCLNIIPKTTASKPFVGKPRMTVNDAILHDLGVSEAWANPVDYIRTITIHTGSRYTCKIPNNHIFLSTSFQTHSPHSIYSTIEKLSKNIEEMKHISRIDIICYDDTPIGCISNFIASIHGVSVHVHLDHSQFQAAKETLGDAVEYQLYYFAKDINNATFELYNELNGVNLNVFITSNSDFVFVTQIDIPISLHPIPNFENGLLKELLWTHREDVMAQNLSMKDILANRTFNKLFFGELTVLHDGTICSHFQDSYKVGNIHDINMHEAAIRFLSKNSPWFLRRSAVQPCCNCLFCELCPPISGVELSLQKYDLCAINSSYEVL